ncbi:hypothetical protein, partial [Methylocella silvestris]|uniref:hypothetical protein n=1 Tax=Methylocella silvestris TaxID=199596 RepID=UPI001AECCA39
FSANAICSSLYLDFFISQLLARRLKRPENSHSKWMKKQGGRHLVRNSSLQRRTRFSVTGELYHHNPAIVQA